MSTHYVCLNYFCSTVKIANTYIYIIYFKNITTHIWNIIKAFNIKYIYIYIYKRIKRSKYWRKKKKTDKSI